MRTAFTRTSRRPRATAWAGAVFLLATVAGCNTQAIINDGLAAGDPGRVDGPVGPPPVPPAALGIAPTGLPPTATTAVAPVPVMPKMDMDFRDRTFPDGAGPTLPPATRAADLADVPYGNAQLQGPATREGGR